MMLFSFIILGMFLDDTAMLVIVAPLYIPLVKALGFDLIWFGILYTITCQIAYIVPPFGYNLFLMRAMAPPEITIVDIYRSIIPFFFLMVLTMIIIMIFPEIAMWLPDVYWGRDEMQGERASFEVSQNKNAGWTEFKCAQPRLVDEILLYLLTGGMK